MWHDLHGDFKKKNLVACYSASALACYRTTRIYMCKLHQTYIKTIKAQLQDAASVLAIKILFLAASLR